MRETSRTIEEVLGHEISTVITAVHRSILLPVSVWTVFERDRSDASLFLSFQEELHGEQGTLTVLPSLGAEITELVLATTSTPMSATLIV